MRKKIFKKWLRKNIFNANIETLTRHLILNAESMDDDAEKEYRIDMLPIMEYNQILELYNILFIEKSTNTKLDKKYVIDIEELEIKHTIEWIDFYIKDVKQGKEKLKNISFNKKDFGLYEGIENKYPEICELILKNKFLNIEDKQVCFDILLDISDNNLEFLKNVLK